MKALALVIGLLAPCPALADLIEVRCHFTTECFDTEACAETDYRLSFQRDTAAEQVITQLRDDAQNVQVVPFAGAAHYGLQSNSADSTQRLLSVKDGVARYSIHMLEEGIALFYLGTCTEITS